MKQKLKKEINDYLDEYEARVIEREQAGYVDSSWKSKSWKAEAYWLLLKVVNRKGKL